MPIIAHLSLCVATCSKLVKLELRIKFELMLSVDVYYIYHNTTGGYTSRLVYGNLSAESTICCVLWLHFEKQL